jgi:biopolymer transport protein ExbD
MAMSVGGEGGEDGPMSDINTTPLVDVMLVLLIIFLIAVPVVVKTVKLNLPVVQYKPTVSKAENILLSVVGGQDRPCEVSLNQTRLTYSKLAELAASRYMAETKRLGVEEAKDPDNYPEVHIRGDQRSAFKCIGGVMDAVQSGGFLKIGMLTSPNPLG